MNNKSCILTVIKNEHEYLDEWIKYHLDLGINHIFIFEDIDSDSHKEICEKYGDKITLNNIDVVLDEQNKKKIRELKLLINLPIIIKQFLIFLLFFYYINIFNLL